MKRWERESEEVRKREWGVEKERVREWERESEEVRKRERGGEKERMGS